VADPFAALQATLRNDPSLSVAIVYRPKTGGVIPCRANYAEPDVTAQLQTAKVRDRKRVLSVSQSDVEQPANGDEVEIPAGGMLYRVVDFDGADVRRLGWNITVAPQ